MNQTELLNYMQHPELLDSESLANLQTLVASNPYFQTAHLLLLKNCKIIGNIKTTADLSKHESNIYIGDRKILQKFLLPKEQIQKEISEIISAKVHEKKGVPTNDKSKQEQIQPENIFDIEILKSENTARIEAEKQLQEKAAQEELEKQKKEQEEQERINRLNKEREERAAKKRLEEQEKPIEEQEKPIEENDENHALLLAQFEYQSELKDEYVAKVHEKVDAEKALAREERMQAAYEYQNQLKNEYATQLHEKIDNEKALLREEKMQAAYEYQNQLLNQYAAEVIEKYEEKKATEREEKMVAQYEFQQSLRAEKNELQYWSKQTEEIKVQETPETPETPETLEMPETLTTETPKDELIDSFKDDLFEIESFEIDDNSTQNNQQNTTIINETVQEKIVAEEIEGETLADKILRQVEERKKKSSTKTKSSEAKSTDSTQIEAITNKTDLIEAFIQKSDEITPIKIQNKQVADISEKSVEENDSLITETLAKIYVKQKHYEKAIEAYQKLSLKIPEKSSFFASEIEKIQKIIN